MVDNVAATLDAIIGKGGEIVQPIGEDAPEITARFRDPAGNVIGLLPATCLIPAIVSLAFGAGVTKRRANSRVLCPTDRRFRSSLTLVVGERIPARILLALKVENI
jgi:hypothetical protein